MPDQPTAPETTPAADGAPAEPAPAPSRSIAPQGLLTHATDIAPRPGFRAPPNNKSRAQQAPKKRK